MGEQGSYLLVQNTRGRHRSNYGMTVQLSQNPSGPFWINTGGASVCPEPLVPRRPLSHFFYEWDHWTSDIIALMLSLSFRCLCRRVVIEHEAFLCLFHRNITIIIIIIIIIIFTIRASKSIQVLLLSKTTATTMSIHTSPSCKTILNAL